MLANSFEMYPTIVTPFDQNGAVDYESLEKLLQYFHSISCDGVFAVCQSSEMFFLTDDEKITLAQACIQGCHALGMKCVVSGHTQIGWNEQTAYLKRLEQLKPDAIILTNNHLAAADAPEAVVLENFKRLCSEFKQDTILGIYECPYPSKRPLTKALLAAMAADGRFRFVKDTSCQIEIIRERLNLLKGSGVRLYNANAATLLESLRAGAAGYSGVMLNLIPTAFDLLKKSICRLPAAEQRSAALCDLISAASVIEYQNYPANAKYLLQKKGIFKTTVTRNGKPALTESQKKEMDAFEKNYRQLYTHLLPHAAVQLLFQPDAYFAECHASTVLPLNRDHVLIAYFAGSREQADDVAIYLSVIRNGVAEVPRRIAKVCNEAHWNPVLFACPEGVRLVFKVGRQIPTWRSYSCLSRDGGETWSEPKLFGEDNPAGGPVKNKPILLSDGRMLAPASDETAETWLPRIDESVDGGKTFRTLAKIPLNRAEAGTESYISGKGAIQPTLWADERGVVHAFLRTDEGALFRSDSIDGGRHWRPAYRTSLPNNNSGVDIACCKEGLFLAMNPVKDNWGARTPLMLMKSDARGETFEDFCVLADLPLDDMHGRGAEFSYPALVARDGYLYVTFTWQRKSIAYCRLPLTEMKEEKTAVSAP